MAEVHPENAIVAGQEHAASHGGMPQFNVQSFAPQLIWLAITFVALYVILSRLILPRIGGAIEARQGRISGDLDEAARLKRETEDAVSAYEHALAEARVRAHAIATEQRATLTAEIEARNAELDQQLSRQTEEAEARIGRMREQALANVQDIAVDAALAIVEKLIGESADDGAVRNAVLSRLRAAE